MKGITSDMSMSVLQEGHASKTFSAPDSTGIELSNISVDSGLEEDSFAIMVGSAQDYDCAVTYLVVMNPAMQKPE